LFAHDDVPLLSVEYINKATNGVIRSYNRDVEAVNPGRVRTSIWSEHTGACPAGTTYQLRVTFAANCTAKVLIGGGASGLQLAPLDRVAAAIGDSTSPSSGITATTLAARELLIGAVGLEGPWTDQDGTWLNSFTRLGYEGTSGQGAASNVTVHLGYRTVSVSGGFWAGKINMTNRRWAAVVATYKGALQ
jgi:hypothetical protein